MTHSSELLKGTLQTIVLKVLKDQAKLWLRNHQRVKELSEGSIVLMKVHSINLHNWRRRSVKNERVMIGKRVRKYYMLTLGKSEARERVLEFRRFY